MIHKYAFATALFSFCFSILFSQNVKLFGYVKDSVSGETLIGANVYLPDEKKGTSTNNFGFFCSSMQNNVSTKIEISFVGYTTKTIELTLSNDTDLNILLRPSVLKEVVIKENKTNTFRHGEIMIPIEKLKVISSLAGEPDIIRALSLLPGIATGVEGTTGLYIRGGTPDQNLILLDGATVYNASHVFGFLSVFNPSAIKSMSVYKGGFPARYGGRLSSVLDITMKEGNSKKPNTEFSIGTLTSSYLTEGPIKKDKSSFMISGRASYSSIFTLPSLLLYAHQTNYFDFLMYDLNAKANFELSNHEKLFVSSYFGNDFYDSGDKHGGTDKRNTLGWSNQTASLRYTNIIRSNFFASTLLNFNKYNYYQNITEKDDSVTYSRLNVNRTSSVQDWATKINFDYSVGKHSIKFGVESALHQFQPDKLHIIIRQPELTVRDNLDTLYHAVSAALFIEDEIHLSKKIDFNIGLRWSNYFISGRHYNQIEPRLLATYTFNENNSFSVSATKMAQFIHLLTASTTSSFGNDVWVPATQQVPLETSWQAAASYTRKFTDSDWSIQLEAFYKRMDGLIDYRGGQNIFALDKNWQDLIQKNGIGRAYGTELFVKKEGEKHSGWISYTLAWSERQFTNINKGNWYPQHYDRRHNFNIVYAYKLSKKWTLNANFVYQTGYAISLPDLIYFDDQGYRTAFYTSKNNARAPDYQRLDVSFTKAYKNKKNRDCKWVFSLYNVYGYPNPFAVSYTVTGDWRPTTGVVDLGYGGIVQTITPFKFIPGISWSLKF